ncbi:hypothetical protein LLEC1_02773 [Akanthomyces lecanii]|uniref:Uncharacterized protein n=1 Tax=Cordyceps confragosa TaxID=2714763 RepID=A0A179I8C9_CORDF|nr:hypothetical protein LLEC1_02773 [Akanthomyces lecanii]
MTEILAPYSHEHFHSLPTVKDAHDAFKVLDGQSHVEWFKNFFVEHGMERKFGLAMMHRHFDMDPSEKLVEYLGTSTPWAGSVAGMREPQPCMWAFDSQGLLRPTEYRYSTMTDGTFEGNELEFAAKLKAELASRGLFHLFGLARYPGDNFAGSCEFTQGRANINLHPKDYPDDLRAFSTIWFFSPPLWERKCSCKCNEVSKDHSHQGHRSSS